MGAANIELCRELYELSGWGDTDNVWEQIASDNHPIPAYETDWLLAKLPSGAGVIKNSSYPEQTYTARRPNMLGAPENKDPLNGRIGWDSDTPANALCVMAIELFKKGILTPTKRQ